MEARTTFSQRVRHEIIEHQRQQKPFGEALLGVSLLTSEQREKGFIAIGSYNPEGQALLHDVVRSRLTNAASEANGAAGSLKLNVDTLRPQLKNILGKSFELDATALPCGIREKLPPRDLRHLMSAFFVLFGSVSEPTSSYHLSFSLGRETWARLLSDILSRLDISSRFIHHSGHCVVYVKDGQNISDLLLNVGAHRAMLEYESLRVEKEMRNQVNRVVNCDNANLARIANAGVRQIMAIQKIVRSRGLGMLPEELQKVARLRLEHPELSLQEMGELLDPSLGKSGVFHRLQKIEMIAKDLD